MTRWTVLGVALGVAIVGAALGVGYDLLAPDLIPILGLTMLTLGVLLLTRLFSARREARPPARGASPIWTPVGVLCLGGVVASALVLGPSPDLGPAALVGCMLGVTLLARGLGSNHSAGLGSAAGWADPPLARTGGAAGASTGRRAA